MTLSFASTRTPRNAWSGAVSRDEMLVVTPPTVRPIELRALHRPRWLVNPKVTAFVTFLVEAFPDRLLQNWQPAR
ncbi:hypothetical protein [Reyranella sp. CPCC 100927]|uniref:hypothetical protein n=1 Tax=Reyranella sp. CPCC 100927 TaxID=2599616 RepID=UPI0011B6A21A|nr:hypothetical protein [Reyranella sp. CPCC 100927]TWS97061.1 hypothetical protein FQU96_37965 [Reyranella sp. CPCC 100927]